MVKLRTSHFLRKVTTTVLTVLSLMTVLGSLCGCGGSTVKREQIILKILPDAHINDDRSVCVVIRKMNGMDFLVDNYDNISNMVYANPPNESVLAWRIILPGQKERIEITKPEKSDIGVYGLFINPGENWKVKFEQPLNLEYNIKIKDNELERYEKGGFW
jgi:hypothetical protein